MLKANGYSVESVILYFPEAENSDGRTEQKKNWQGFKSHHGVSG